MNLKYLQEKVEWTEEHYGKQLACLGIPDELTGYQKIVLYTVIYNHAHGIEFPKEPEGEEQSLAGYVINNMVFDEIEP